MTGGVRARRRNGGEGLGGPRAWARRALGRGAAAAFAFALAWAGLAALPSQGVGAQASAPGEGGATAECDVETMICIEVFEDDPDAVTARWDGAAKVWVVEPPNGYVQVRHKRDTVTSRRLQLQEEEEHVRLEEDVLVVREDLEGRSRALDLWWNREEYWFTGDVQIVQREHGNPVRTLWADEVRYVGEGERVTATGNVRMVDDRYRVRAETMTYRKEPEEVMTFTGKVQVQSLEPGSEWTMSGERFEYDLEAEQGLIVGPHRIEVTPKD